MPGTVHDGHQFVDGAFAAGAAGAHRLAAGRAARTCWSPTRSPRSQALGRASRERSKATIIGVTGSVGKTSTKEALFAALDRNRPGKVHRSVKSYNNHTGVPLSLARMPRDARVRGARNGHEQQAGEIAALTRQVRPHVALDHRDRPGAHRESRLDRGDRRRQGARSSRGSSPTASRSFPNDTPHRDRLVKAARRHADRIITFGSGDADVHAVHAVTRRGRRQPDQRGAARTAS